LSAGQIHAQDSIKVGIILPLTGGQAAFGEIEKNSFEMALDEINAAGGINGKKLDFVFEDDTGKPEVARSAAESSLPRTRWSCWEGAMEVPKPSPLPAWPSKARCLLS